MFLSQRRQTLLGRIMRTLAEPHDEIALREAVGKDMLDLLGAQYYASYVWRPHTESFDGRVHLNMDADNLRRYERYYQYKDPITLKMQRHRRAVRAVEVMPQDQLLGTEFFNDFLRRDGLHWGINLHVWRADRHVGDLRIWRDRRRDDFGDDEVALLDLLRPAFSVALDRVGGGASTSSDLDSLSRREAEVARLVATGLSDKEVARALSISATTVRTHLAHVFHKLGVGSRTRLAIRLQGIPSSI